MKECRNQKGIDKPELKLSGFYEILALQRLPVRELQMLIPAGFVVTRLTHWF